MMLLLVIFLNMQFVNFIVVLTCWTLLWIDCSVPYDDILLSARCKVYCGSQNDQLDWHNDKMNNMCYDNCKQKTDWKQDLITSVSATDYNMSQPSLLCQEFTTKSIARIVLNWSITELVESAGKAMFIVEVEFAHQPRNWNVIGTTHNTFIKISDLVIGQKYRFRVTAVGSLTLVSSPTYSSWIHISRGAEAISAPSNVRIREHLNDNDKFDIFVDWSPSEDRPCSYDVTLLPEYEGGNFRIESVSLPLKTGYVLFPNLSPGTNNTLKITPYDPSGMQSVNSVVTHFMITCRYFHGNVSDACVDDRPQNLTATWLYDSSEVLIKWMAPKPVIENSLAVNYTVSIWNEILMLPGNLLSIQTLPVNVSEARVKITTPLRRFVVKVSAAANGHSAKPAIMRFEAQIGKVASKVASNHIWTWVISVGALFSLAGFIALLIRRRGRFEQEQKPEPYLCWRQRRVPEQLKPYVIPSHRVFRHEELGHGAFGVVYKGTLTNPDEETVAIKEFLMIENVIQEAEMMESLGRHPHIVSLRGICIDADPVCILLEYCPLRDLLTWLRSVKNEFGSPASYDTLSSEDNSSLQLDLQNTSVSSQTAILNHSDDDALLDPFESRRLLYIYQVALAMVHIASNKLIHRDIAARNVLLYSDNVVKLADFGLARDIYEETLYVIKESRRLPIRWMAPEALETHAFTLSTDVWSFGVFMWEVMSFGTHPYPGLQNDQILPSLQEGMRMEKPQHCSTNVYNIMKSCWHKEPKRRPSFMELKRKLEEILEKAKYVQL